jgi:hypothetical protein
MTLSDKDERRKRHYVGGYKSMSIQNVKVPVTLIMQEDVAKLIARAEFEGIYSTHGAELKLQELKAAGITPATLATYFSQLQVLTCAFAEDKRDVNAGKLRDLKFRFSELKNLYLTPIIATILSQVGDVQIGNYMIEVCVPADGIVERDFVIKMSEALYENQHLLYSQRDQIGQAKAAINADFMANIVTTMDATERVATVRSKDGYNPDVKFKALATLAGVSLVNSAYSILYPVVDYVEYGRPGDYLAIPTATAESK